MTADPQLNPIGEPIVSLKPEFARMTRKNQLMVAQRMSSSFGNPQFRGGIATENKFQRCYVCGIWRPPTNFRMTGPASHMGVCAVGTRCGKGQWQSKPLGEPTGRWAGHHIAWADTAMLAVATAVANELDVESRAMPHPPISKDNPMPDIRAKVDMTGAGPITEQFNLVEFVRALQGDLKLLRAGKITIADARARAELARQSLRGIQYMLTGMRFLEAQANVLPPPVEDKPEIKPPARRHRR